MSNVLTIILFFVYAWGLGYTLISLLKLKSQNKIEDNLISMGVGLGVIPILGVTMNLIHIPLKWWLFLLLSISYPLYEIYLKIKNRPKKEERSIRPPSPSKMKGMFLSAEMLFLVGVLILYVIMNAVYIGGAMKYPYLEDGDSYRHTAEAYMIAKTGSFSWVDKPWIMGNEEPYPQGYPLLMGILFQTTSSYSDTIKIINATIVSLSLIFFYLFVKKWTNIAMIGFFSTLCLWAIPSFMTHFIWATTLSLTLFFPAFYALESIKENKKWFIVAGIVIASLLVTQVTTAIVFGLFFVVYMLVKELIERNNAGYIFAAGVLAVILALLFYVPAYFHVGSKFIMQFGLGEGQVSPFDAGAQAGQNVLYTLKDFVSSPPYGAIDNSVGIGPILIFITIVGLASSLGDTKKLFAEKRLWNLIVVIWFIVAFIGVIAGRFPVSLFPHRFWAILAIPTCILAGASFYYLWRYLYKTKFSPVIVIIVISLMVVGTSGYGKYKINTATWGWGAGIQQNPEDMKAYLYLRQLPAGSKVFPVCAPVYVPIGFDREINWYDENVFDKSIMNDENILSRMSNEQRQRFESTTKLLNETPQNAHEWLRQNGFSYVIVDSNCARVIEAERVGVVFTEWLRSEQFASVFRTSTSIVLEVK